MLLPGEWYHTAMVYDESTLKLFLNGEEVASRSLTGRVDQANFIDIGVGGQPNGGSHWDGLIDDVIIAQRPYSDAELQALFVGGRPITTDDSYPLMADQQFVATAINGVLANDIDTEGDLLTANLFTDVSNGVLDFNNDGSFAYTPDLDFSGTDSFTYVATDGSNNSRVTTVDLIVAPAGDSIIDVWYGANQTFGNIGRPQVWANVVGNVSDPDGVVSLSYTLNGGNARALSVGSDGRRLFNEGDFNIDLTRDDLLEGDNLVEITAVDTQNSITSTTVTVNYSSASVWPDTYEVDWSEVGSIQEATEILDGLWEITPDGIRTVEAGYDRLFAIGEVSWDQYELVSSFTLHDYDSDNFGGVGVIGPWNGHTDDPIAGAQPKTGFLPFGSQTWTAFFPGDLPSRIQSAGHEISRELQNFAYELEQQYHFRYRVERVNQNFLLYSTKVWADGTAEPADWDVQYTDTTSGLTDGSVVFVAHFADVTFGDISIVPVTSPPPSAVADVYSTLFETPLTVDAASGVLGNDSGGNGVLTAMLAADVSNGTLTLNADGSFDYVPADGFFGLDSFSYYATDGESDSAPVQVDLSVADPNADVDLLAHLSLDDDQTLSIATDSSLYGNNGEISGATYVADAFDGSSSSLEFDGDDVVNLGGLDVNGTGLTLAAWVRADTFPGSNLDPRIISKASGIAANTHVFMLSTTRRGSTDEAVLRARVRINGVTTTYRANVGVLLPGVWYHTAMVYDESTLKLYLDGVEIASADVRGPVDQDSNIDVGIGGQPNGGSHWDGRIDDVRIAQRPYSAVEIQALAEQGGGGNNSPLALDDSYAGFTDEELNVSAAAGVLANDSDVDGDTFVARLEADVSNGVLSFNADGSFTYTPESGFIGTDSFSYVASDGSSDSGCLLYTSPSPRDGLLSRMPSSA